MRKRTIILAGAILTTAAVWIGWRRDLVPSSIHGAPDADVVPLATGRTFRSPPPVLPRKEPKEIVLLPEAAEIAGRLHASDTTAADDLEALELLVSIYRRSNGGANPPGGENDEIIRQLTGRNNTGFAVLPANHPAISPAGRLLDRWGTPYYFHPVSREVLGLRSAGPDGKLFTPDDIVVGDDAVTTGE